jgi:thiopeptide-type bacteriocin biosynthesis protein
MRAMFEAEFGKKAYEEKYGANGEIPIFPNNSIQYIDYEPEYHYYGGRPGLELAEQHFWTSSSIVLDILRQDNSNVKTIILGQALQLMLHFAGAFFGFTAGAANFFKWHKRVWSNSDLTSEQQKLFEQGYARQADKLKKYVARALNLQSCLSSEDGTLLRDWAAHAKWLSFSARELYRSGMLSFNLPAASEDDAILHLATRYMHMTNNRLGVTMQEEVYLSHLLSHALNEINAAPERSNDV